MSWFSQQGAEAKISILSTVLLPPYEYEHNLCIVIPGRAAPSQRLKGRSHFSRYLSLQPLNGGRAGSVGGLNPEQSPEPPQTRRPPRV